MGATISTEQWLAELERLTRESKVDGHTANELAEVWSCGISSARRRIKSLHRLGRIEYVGLKNVPAIDGTQRKAPAYRLKPIKPVGKERR